MNLSDVMNNRNQGDTHKMQGCSNDSWRNQHVKSVNSVNTSLCVSCVKRSSAATEFRFLLMQVWSCLDVWWVQIKQKTDIYHPHTRWLCSTLCHSSMQNDCVLRRGLPLYPKINSNSLINIFGHELLLFRDRRETTAAPPSYKAPVSRSLFFFLHFSKSFSVRSYHTTVPHKHMNKKLFDNMHQWV